MTAHKQTLYVLSWANTQRWCVTLMHQELWPEPLNVLAVSYAQQFHALKCAHIFAVMVAMNETGQLSAH